MRSCERWNKKVYPNINKEKSVKAEKNNIQDTVWFKKNKTIEING